MMQELFKNGPTISYGKRKNLDSGIVEDYLILPDSTKGFTSDEKNYFEKICKSFSWTSTSNPAEILPPCYGFFPSLDNSSILVARFIDDGRDNQGRADLLRVDALKVPAKLFIELKSDLKLIFDFSIWKNIFAVENSMAEQSIISSDVCEKILELVKENITVPLLVGCSYNFKFKPTSGKFNTFDINSKTIEKICVPVVASPSNPRIPLAPPKPNSIVVVQKNLSLVVLLMLGLICCYLYYASANTALMKQRDVLAIEKVALNKEKYDLVSDNKKLTDQFNDLAKLKNINIDDLIKKLGDKPGMKHALEVLNNIRGEAYDSFAKEIKGKFKTEFEKESKKFNNSMIDWLDKQNTLDSKQKVIKGMN